MKRAFIALSILEFLIICFLLGVLVVPKEPVWFQIEVGFVCLFFQLTPVVLLAWGLWALSQWIFRKFKGGFMRATIFLLIAILALVMTPVCAQDSVPPSEEPQQQTVEEAGPQPVPEQPRCASRVTFPGGYVVTLEWLQAAPDWEVQNFFMLMDLLLDMRESGGCFTDEFIGVSIEKLCPSLEKRK